MTLSVHSQLTRDSRGRILFMEPPDDRMLQQYRLEVWVEGSNKDLDLIEHVDYLLHPTFRKQLRSSTDRTGKFSIAFWTWGMFMIQVTVHLKGGERQKYEYYLTYELPPDNGTNYVAS